MAANAASKAVSFTDPAAAFSAAAAHGITQRVIQTWNPDLIRTPRVLVPTEVTALVVRPQQAAQSWADCALRIDPSQTGPVTRYDVLPPPFAELPASRKAGVYLHWALPDALTRIQSDGTTQNATFPSAPDRWLVLRIYPAAPKAAPGNLAAGPSSVARRAIKGWVLRAGDKTPNHVDLDAFTEGPLSPDAVNNPLTVMGTGDAAWAAYYDNCVDRLAFYDSLSDVAQGPVSYLVCGWYSNPAADPLGSQKVHSLTDFNTTMQGFGWQLAEGELDEAVSFARKYIVAARGMGLAYNHIDASLAGNDAIGGGSGQGGFAISNAQPSMPQFDAAGEALGPYTTDGSWWPNATLIHGAVVALGWPQVSIPGFERGLLGGEVGGPPSASAINVAVGNTLTEALATLVAQHNGKPQEAAILEAFMLSSLAELEHPDGRTRLDALLHANAFGSLDGGYTEETINIPAMPDTPSPLPNPVQPGPGVFAGAVAPSNFKDNGFKSGIFHPNKVVLNGQAHAVPAEPVESLVEANLHVGGLSSVINAVSKIPSGPAQIPAHTEQVRRALPRLFFPSEPVFLVEGGSRTFKYGADTRFSQDHTLSCRLTGFCITEISCPIPRMENTAQLSFRPSARGDDVLERGVENGSIPPECEDLLRETILLDPAASYSLASAALNPAPLFRASSNVAAPGAAAPQAAPIQVVNQVAANLSVEQTAWWATRDPRFDHGPLMATSGFVGTLPAPHAIAPPVSPWEPRHLDWEIEYIPSTSGISDWSLGEIDFTSDPKVAPSVPLPDPASLSGITQGKPVATTPAGSYVFVGRAHLTGSAGAAAAASLRQAMSQAQAAGGAALLTPNSRGAFHSGHAQLAMLAYGNMAQNIRANYTQAANAPSGYIPPVDRSALQDILDTLDSMDVLAGAADNLTRQMRGGFATDGTSKPADGSIPTPFIPLRAGFLRVLRLRLVDGYGQFLDLLGSSDTSFANSSALMESAALVTPGRSELLALPPRFTSPSRLWFRYMAGDGSENEANADVSPVCGYLMPNHLDGDLEFFGIDGANLGFVRPDPQAGVVWEDAPGVPSTVG
ncbi:MAG: hypothetical protein WCA37_10675, partial [Terracidiphilus sp.]